MCVGSYVTQNRTEVLSKEEKMARSLTSNNIKGFNSTHTDEDNIKNNLNEDVENDAEFSLEPVATHEISRSFILPQECEFFIFINVIP